jgi:hypothetical protein
MEPTAPMTPDLLLAALNGDYDYGQYRRTWAVRFGLTAAKAKEYVRTNQDFRQLLCSYVDMWLETGRERVGTDRPSTRKPTMDIQAIVNGYLRTHPALPLRFEKGYQVAIPFHLTTFPAMRHKRLVPKKLIPSIGLVRSVRGTHQPLKDVKDDVQRLFVGMLFAEWSMRIAKCRRIQCGRYYILNKPRAFYKRGTFCRRCSSSVSAAQRTTIQRRSQHEMRVRMAAKAYVEWEARDSKKRRRLGSLKEYIASELRRQRQKLTVKWVTRNMKHIEAIAT